MDPTNQRIVQLRNWEVGQDEPLVFLVIMESSLHVHWVHSMARYGDLGQNQVWGLLVNECLTVIGNLQGTTDPPLV